MHDSVECCDCADHAFAKRDDHEQPVALGDVVRVPRRPAALLSLGDERSRQLEKQQRSRNDQARRHGQPREEQEHPADLRDGVRRDVWLGDPPARPIVPRRSCPEEHHAEAHHDVSADHHTVVEALAVIDRREHLLESERENDRADHLQHRQQAADPVVGVVGRGEPRVVDPRPADREGGEQEPDDRRANVVSRQVVREPTCCSPERDRERQVVQQLQRCCDVPRFVRVASGQRTPAVGSLRSPCGHGPNLLKASAKGRRPVPVPADRSRPATPSCWQPVRGRCDPQRIATNVSHIKDYRTRVAEPPRRLLDPSRSRCQRRMRTSFNNEGRPTARDRGLRWDTLVRPIFLMPGVSKRCRARPWESVADLVGADASCSDEQAGAHQLPRGEPGQPDSEGSSHFPTTSERAARPASTASGARFITRERAPGQASAGRTRSSQRSDDRHASRALCTRMRSSTARPIGTDPADRVVANAMAPGGMA